MTSLRPPSRADTPLLSQKSLFNHDNYNLIHPETLAGPAAFATASKTTATVSLAGPAAAVPQRPQKTARAAEPSISGTAAEEAGHRAASLSQKPALPPPLPSQRIQVAVRVRPLPTLRPPLRANALGTRSSPLAPITPGSRRASTSGRQISRTPSLTSVATSTSPIPPYSLEPCVNITPAHPDVAQVCDPTGRRPKREFAYDAVFAEEDSSATVYDRMVRGLVEQCLAGYNGCVLAYGQTASGKTFTMEGIKPSPLHPPPSDPESRGLMLRVAADVVDHISRSTAAEEAEKSEEITQFSVKATYLEIYQETLKDLLCDSDGQADLRIRIDPDSLSGRELYVQGLTEREVVTLEDYVRVAHTGTRRRTVGETDMNNVSSRSHAVLTLTIEQITRRRGGSSPDDISSRKRSKIHLVDLAGSERANSTGATGTRLKEGSSINQSLLSLGNVISALSAPSSGRPAHVSYRDSKLTYLLSDSLGGNALTVMIACVSPAASCYDETVGTLRFAERAKKVKLRATVNVDLQSLRISTLEAEIAQLRQQIESSSSFNSTSLVRRATRDAHTSTRMPTASACDASCSAVESPPRKSRWARLTTFFAGITGRGRRNAATIHVAEQ
ncbi:Kinesin-like protein kif3a [Geranomyces michiganensis]|nr:Kinesin-like protein kif3a [Geranomyces michiganensis]